MFTNVSFLGAVLKIWKLAKCRYLVGFLVSSRAPAETNERTKEGIDLKAVREREKESHQIRQGRCSHGVFA